MTEEKRRALERAAEATSRSMSSYIDFALTKALREDGYLAEPAKPAPRK